MLGKSRGNRGGRGELGKSRAVEKERVVLGKPGGVGLGKSRGLILGSWGRLGGVGGRVRELAKWGNRGEL